jgi:GT2 family glycosyltransferase
LCQRLYLKYNIAYPLSYFYSSKSEYGHISMNTAILFLIFNRPDTTRRVMEAIRKARPTRLYVAADGPRPHRVEEVAHCEETKRIATAIDWPCDVKTLFRGNNLGCRRAVSEAIDWFFEHEEQGIILEDDCLPDQSFFPFVEEMLERYRWEESIFTIAGVHFHRQAHQPEHSYFFSRYNRTGGASWRRTEI